MTKCKTYTVCLIGNFEKPMRQFRVPSLIVWPLCIALVCGVAFASSSLRSYLQLKTVHAQDLRMSRKLEDQQSRLHGQQHQIKAFAAEINRLQAHLLKLNRFARKIRIIANVRPAEASLFGMGGDPLEDIDPSLSMTARHSALIREMYNRTHQLETASEREKTSFKKLLASLENQVDILAATPSIRPAPGWITSHFAYRISPFTGKREFHYGLDIADRVGTPVEATADGTIIFSGHKGLLGTCVIIDHGHGITTRYGHLSKLLRKKGDKVKRGETIGLMGDTGLSTGPHVHYEVRLDGVPVNPEKYILN